MNRLLSGLCGQLQKKNQIFKMSPNLKKHKVLLRKRKRHTAYRVASTRCGGGEGGVPTLPGGYLPWPHGGIHPGRYPLSARR